jgi:hypothetical protein
VHGDDREMGQHGEGGEGISAPCLPWVGVVCGGGSAQGGGCRCGSAAVLRGGGAEGFGGGSEAVVEVRGGVGSVGPYL